NLGRVRAVAFDKTGTLTQGRPTVTDIIPFDSVSSDELLALAAAVEKGSTHPLAAAIVNEARSRGHRIPEASDAQQIAGQGVRAIVNGQSVAAGRAEMFPSANGDGQRLADAVAQLAI